jgi:transposase
MANRKQLQLMQVRPVRNFAEEFKRKKVNEIQIGITKVSEICKAYSVSAVAVYKWIYKYSDMKKNERTIVESKSDTRKIEDLKLQIARLEQSIGQKQIKIDFLEKMIDIAEETYKVDIKKKLLTTPSGGFGNIGKK